MVSETAQVSRLHHVALGADDVEGVARFYVEAFGLDEVARHVGAQGLRSIWIGLSPGSVLMIEKTEEARERVGGIGKGPFLLAFSIPPEQRAAWESRLERSGAPIESRSEYSSYARDPEGNRVALSFYPLPVSASRE